ncbi:MAG: nickel-dependent hydrogenase large subunit [Mycobacterium sp.]|nr:nickel-dependent hydrogenase large subunit [Mycobacterium sp.]
MGTRITLDLNRVEGDLEVQLDVEDNRVRDSWCVGTMYRGYEQILAGRAPSDVLVIVPRICGICSTAQLYAGVRALEDAWGVQPAERGARAQPVPDGRGRHDDTRQTFLMFCSDFCHPAYRSPPRVTRTSSRPSSLRCRTKGRASRACHRLAHRVARRGKGIRSRECGTGNPVSLDLCP